ncbi:MAG TPA: lactate utilization protein [Methylomirabilota bacterium]|nr:lactate utilization protein [Methylomirabilota bacterium]
MTARAEFLERIRREVGKTRGLFQASTAPRPAQPAQVAEAVRRQMVERWPQALERFREEFEQVAGVFHRVRTLGEVPGVVAAIAKAAGAREVVTWDPASLGLDLRPTLAGQGLAVSLVPAGQEGEAARLRHREEAARAKIGVTGVDWALAETGTLILVSGPGRPRSTSLLPDTHVAVFGPEHVLESLEQVGIMLEALHADGAPGLGGAMINFITGPSRTADIELTLTRGVHGPKEVHAIFYDER